MREEGTVLYPTSVLSTLCRLLPSNTHLFLLEPNILFVLPGPEQLDIGRFLKLWSFSFSEKWRSFPQTLSVEQDTTLNRRSVTWRTLQTSSMRLRTLQISDEAVTFLLTPLACLPSWSALLWCGSLSFVLVSASSPPASYSTVAALLTATVGFNRGGMYSSVLSGVLFGLLYTALSV